jgi:quercetin dioxygenase-like cupin family protein
LSREEEEDFVIVTTLAALSAVVMFSGEGAALSGPEPALAVTAADPALKWGPCPPPFTAGCEIAVLHGDPARPNADVFLRVPGGYSLPAHSHTSAERMILVSGELKVRYQGAPPAALKPGAYAFGPAKRPHDGSCVSQQKCTLFIAFEGPVDAVAFQGSLD